MKFSKQEKQFELESEVLKLILREKILVSKENFLIGQQWLEIAKEDLES
jgi:hypothetical protein